MLRQVARAQFTVPGEALPSSKKAHATKGSGDDFLRAVSSPGWQKLTICKRHEGGPVPDSERSRGALP